MKSRIMIGLLVLGLGFAPSIPLFAHEGNEAEFVKLLQSSASALQASQPALAADLTAFANEEANEKEGKEEPKEKNTPERLARRNAHMKLLKDSAAALQSSHPDLAAKLSKRAERIAKKIAENK